ncbi:MAG: InlB B-repeat-containing protein [Clostridia bacterium]|nr:InlB B-repeat-containing protein [Clostridia bacterium]
MSTGVTSEVISPDVGSYSIYYFTISESGTLTYYLSDAPNKSYSSYGTVALSEISATYTITYMVGGEVYATDTYSEGDTITPPEDPTSDSGTFSRWESLPETMPANDITVTAIFTSAECDHSETTLYTITAATCTTDGEAEIICSLCGEILGYQTIPASHTEGEWEIVTEATCTATGERVKKCTVCGQTLETEVIAMTAHTYGDWEVVDGETVHVCTVCGYTETYAAASETEGVTGTADGTADDTAGGTSSDTGDADDGTSRGVSATAVIIYIIVLIVVGGALGAVIYFAIKMDKKHSDSTVKSNQNVASTNYSDSPNANRKVAKMPQASSENAARNEGAAKPYSGHGAQNEDTAAGDETVVFDAINYSDSQNANRKVASTNYSHSTSQSNAKVTKINYSDSPEANRKVASTAKPYSGVQNEGTAASGHNARNEDAASKTTSSSSSTTTSSSTSETIFDDWTDEER